MSMLCCYFPTRVVIVDDVRSLSEGLSLHLGSNVAIFDCPRNALDALSPYQPVVTDELWLKANHNSDEADGQTVQPLLLDIAALRGLDDCVERLNDISVVIVDYHMPGMNGLELLAALKNKPFKKILLTGEGDHALAVKAFNSGLIDCFIRKDEENLSQKLVSEVQRLQRQYFYDLGKKTINFIPEMRAKDDYEWQAYFDDLIRAQNITEYYLLNIYGHYKLINQSGHSSFLLVNVKSDFQHLLSLAKDDHAPPSVIEALRTGSHIPFFGETRPFWEVPASKWSLYLKPTTLVRTEKNIYFVARAE